MLNHVGIESLLGCAVKLNVFHFSHQVTRHIIIARQLMEAYLLHLLIPAIVAPRIDQVSRLTLMIGRHFIRVI
jgi:hypothetical protein